MWLSNIVTITSCSDLDWFIDKNMQSDRINKSAIFQHIHCNQLTSTSICRVCLTKTIHWTNISCYKHSKPQQDKKEKWVIKQNAFCQFKHHSFQNDLGTASHRVSLPLRSTQQPILNIFRICLVIWMHWKSTNQYMPLFLDIKMKTRKPTQQPML